MQADKLKRRMLESQATPESLAEAVERTGLEGERAKRAVRNWLTGRDHPRCKASDLVRMAEQIGCEPKDISVFESRVSHHRGSTQKARLVADLVRGKSVAEADVLLHFLQKRAAVNVRKALMAAYAEAEQSGASDPETLFVTDCRVDEGPVIKRFQPKDRGRAHPIHKQTSHITVGVEERG